MRPRLAYTLAAVVSLLLCGCDKVTKVGSDEISLLTEGMAIVVRTRVEVVSQNATERTATVRLHGPIQGLRTIQPVAHAPQNEILTRAYKVRFLDPHYRVLEIEGVGQGEDFDLLLGQLLKNCREEMDALLGFYGPVRTVEE